MGRKAIDMTGMRFGRLTVLEREGTVYSNFKPVPTWLCRCDCGTELVIRGLSLRNGTTRSCGCLRSELARERFLKNNPKKRKGE